MLKTQSFKMTDSEGVNTLLTKYRLAEGAHIFTSNGDIMIPYEDGEPMNDEQKNVATREAINTLTAKAEDLKHSNLVVDRLIENALARVKGLEADLAEAKANKDSKKRTEIESAISTTKNSIQQMLQQKFLNEHEVTRIGIEVDVYTASLTS